MPFVWRYLNNYLRKTYAMHWRRIVPYNDDINAMLESIALSVMNMDNKHPWGLLGGSGGAILFFHYFIQINKQDRYVDYFSSLISRLISEIYDIKTLGICNGLSGICWLLRFLFKSNYLDCCDINNILEYPEKCLLTEIYNSEADTDYLHGTLGIANYFAISDSPFSEEVLDIYIKKLYNSSIKKQNVNVWLTQTYVNHDSVGFVYNLGLSHGMAGVLAFLKNTLRKNKESAIANELMDGLVGYYLQERKRNTDGSLFPKWIDPKNDVCYIENLPSWCYGDPGILNALYDSVSIYSLHDSRNKLIVNELENFINRHHLVCSKIYESNFCHGSSGLMHIYNNFYQKTGFDKFRILALEMYDMTLTRWKTEKGRYAGFILPDANEYANPISFLSGISGIGLASIALMTNCVPEWNEILLL